MKTLHKVAAALAACAMLAAVPAGAQVTPSQDDAMKLRRLDIMLMVSSLRCRFGADNFQADYNRFADSHSATMGAAFRTLSAEYTRRLGAAGAKKELDHVSIGMANTYGMGHPWLGCAQLKGIAQDLATTPNDHARLLAAADDLLAATPRGTAIALNH